VPADLSTPEGAARVVDAAIAGFGAIDILVNNVATAKGKRHRQHADAEWQDAFDQTLYPAIRMSRLVVPHMRQRGGGVIIMIASIWGRESGGRMVYNAVKAAEISLAKAMAQQLAKDNHSGEQRGARIDSFSGGSWDKRQKADPAGIADFIKAELPFGRFGRAEEVGDAVAFLASPRASWISGSCVSPSTAASPARKSDTTDARHGHRGSGLHRSVMTDVLVDAGHDVTVFDNLSRGHRDAISARASWSRAISSTRRSSSARSRTTASRRSSTWQETRWSRSRWSSRRDIIETT
jgi:3-oxoacyl-[acyl-carrier protein] reductase